MTLNGKAVLKYEVDKATAYVVIEADSLDDAAAVVTEDMTLLDSVGKPFLKLKGYTRLSSIETYTDSNRYKINLIKETNAEAKITELYEVTQATQDDTDAMLVDLDYRLTLVELGLSE